MKHHANPRFWRSYQGLPKEVRDLADRSYKLLKSDPTHGSLHFKKTGSLWSVRVGLHYRALATEVGDDLVWFWIGSHAEYDRLVGQKPANHYQASPRQADRSLPSGRRPKPKKRASKRDR